jgi:hypothetical protein
MTVLPETEVFEHTDENSTVVAQLMHDIHSGVERKGLQFSQQMMFHKGRRVFGAKADAAAHKELDQLHRRNCFTPLIPLT